MRSVPAPEQVLESAWEELSIAKMNVGEVRKNFPTLLDGLLSKVYELLKSHQEVAEVELLRLSGEVARTDPKRGSALMRSGQLSLGQQRKKRAGVDMERALGKLLALVGIPNENGQSLTGRSDLVIPSIQMFKTKPERAIILECKRTVRERWKELIDEVSESGHNVWFITFDDQFSKQVVEKITSGGVVLFLMPSVYQKWKENKGVRSLSNLVEDLSYFAQSSSKMSDHSA